MVRALIRDPGVTDEDGFRLRGVEMTRLETFTDAAFAFAATLLVISFDKVPSSYAELMDATRNIPAFLACLAILMLFWRAHERYSRRYGLEDGVTISLTTLLIGLVLVYVYPLKFLATTGFGYMIPALRGPDFAGSIADWGQLGDVFILYGLGYLAMQSIFLLLYARAYAVRERLGLNPLERFDTRSSMVFSGVYLAFGVLSIGLALLLKNGPGVIAAGIVYSGLGAAMPAASAVRERARKRIDRSMA